MTADQTFSLEVSKFLSQECYGIIIPRAKNPKIDLPYLLNKQMILQTLGDSSCLEELTVDEQNELTGLLSLHSEFYG